MNKLITLYINSFLSKKLLPLINNLPLKRWMPVPSIWRCLPARDCTSIYREMAFELDFDNHGQ